MGQWKSMQIWVGTKKLVFCSGCNICLTLFSKSAKWVALYEEEVATSFVCKVCVVLGRLRISLILDM